MRSVRLPSRQSQCARRLRLARMKRLQAPPDVLGYVSRAEQRDDDRRSEQTVLREAFRESQRQQVLRQEQQCYQRNTSEHFDEYHAQHLHHRQFAPPSQRERDAYRQADYDARHREQQINHQSAPVDNRHRLKSGDALQSPQQDQGQQEHDDRRDTNPPRRAQRRIACQSPPYPQRGQVGQQQQSHVHAHGIQAVRKQRERRQSYRDPYGDALCEPSACNSPRHTQKRRYHQQRRLWPPEAVLSRTRRFDVVSTD